MTTYGRLHLAGEEALDLDKIRKLPIYKLPPSYRLGEPGMGCAGDPPGYLSYYMRPIYNQYGNSPSNAPDSVVLLNGVIRIVGDSRKSKGGTWDEYQAGVEKLVRSLYKPLPFEHPRVQAWLAATFAHHGKHYQYPVETGEKEFGRQATFFFPLQSFARGYKYERRHEVFKDRPELSDAWREKERAAIVAINEAIDLENETIRKQNQALSDSLKEMATVDNHVAVRIVRQYYPDAPVEALETLIENRPKSDGTWYETLPERPTPETCPGAYGRKHPMNGSWCQVCGWHKEEVAA